jgi:hypothetical protein
VAETLPRSLQESVLTALCFDQRWGAMIAAQVEPEHFDEQNHYREIARRVLESSQKQGRPPSEAHLDDLLSDLLTGPDASSIRRLLYNLAEQAKTLNAEYVANRSHEFVRDQTIKHALLRASNRYSQGGDDKIPEVEAILYEAMRPQADAIDAGIFLGDIERSLAYLDAPDEEVLSLGITELDKLGVGPTRKELLLYMAPKNTGKTWFAVTCGGQGIKHRQRVLHITAETPAQKVIRRYHQMWFSAATRPDPTDQTILEFDKLTGVLSDWKPAKITPELDLKDPTVRKRLRERIEPWGARFNNLIIKEYPTRTLTMQRLVSYLDFLEQTHNFIPHLLIIDSPDNFKVPIDDFRLRTQHIYEDLRGLAGTRNMAVVATTQGNRKSLDAKRVLGSMISEAVGKVWTADSVLIYSRTEEERGLGFGRLCAEYIRN